MKNRNELLDVAKGIGILLVVFGHNSILCPSPSKAFAMVFSFHMPLFFFLSGVLFNPTKPFGNVLVSKCDSLIKPYLTTTVIVGLEYVLLRGDNLFGYIRDIAYGVGDTLVWISLWFLPHLFLVTVLVRLLTNLLNRKHTNLFLQYAPLFILFLVGLVAMRYFGQHKIHLAGRKTDIIGLPWSMDLLGISSFYFLCGYRLAKQVKQFTPSLLWSTVSLIIFFSTHFFTNASLDMNMRQYDSLIFTTLTTASGIYLTFSISFLIHHFIAMRRVFAFLGISSLFILIFHSYLQSNAIKMIGNFLGNGSASTGVFALMVGTFVPAIIWVVVKNVDAMALLFLPLKHNGLFRKIKSDVRPSGKSLS
ncbi:MAG: acyltransferase family protein [Deltaproteobacteria bacterium]|nr:acyltransferase family protein [Deltaproteobacteria bacterium]